MFKKFRNLYSKSNSRRYVKKYLRTPLQEYRYERFWFIMGRSEGIEAGCLNFAKNSL